MVTRRSCSGRRVDDDDSLPPQTPETSTKYLPDRQSNLNTIHELDRSGQNSCQYVVLRPEEAVSSSHVETLVAGLRLHGVSLQASAYTIQITESPHLASDLQTPERHTPKLLTPARSTATRGVMSPPRSAPPTNHVNSLRSATSDSPRTRGLNTARPHGTSKTWVSSEAKIQRAWFKLEPHLSRMYPEDKPSNSLCPYIPRNLRDFTTHLSEFEQLKLNRTKHILDAKALLRNITEERGRKSRNEKLGIHDLPLPAARVAFDGRLKEFGSIEEDSDGDKKKVNPAYHSNPANRSAVLAQQTIWCINHNVPWREAASWPTNQEMKWEGIQRISTENGKYGRFLALPRVSASTEISWQTLPLTKFYKLDEVWRVPNEEDIFAPTEDIPDELVPKLVNGDILDAIDPTDTL